MAGALIIYAMTLVLGLCIVGAFLGLMLLAEALELLETGVEKIVRTITQILEWQSNDAGENKTAAEKPEKSLEI